jgi:hypothetical protein
VSLQERSGTEAGVGFGGRCGLERVAVCRRSSALRAQPGGAQGGGWTTLVEGPRQHISAVRLAPYLEANFYDGESSWRLVLTPLFGVGLGIALLLLWRASRGTSGAEERHGRRTKGPEMSSAFGWSRAGKSDGIRFQLRRGKAVSGWADWLPFGPGYRIPKRLEGSHILLMGDTGAGKSSAIRQLLRQVEERGESAIVYDPAMDFVAEFYSPERGDLILNPLDLAVPRGAWEARSIARPRLPISRPLSCRRRNTRRPSLPKGRGGFSRTCSSAWPGPATR